MAAGLRTGTSESLGPCTNDLLASVLCLRHGKSSETLPPSARLPQPEPGPGPRVHRDLVSVASPPAFRLGCISGPMLKSAGFEMAQMVWYCGSGVQEQGGKGCSTQNIVEGGPATNREQTAHCVWEVNFCVAAPDTRLRIDAYWNCVLELRIGIAY